jgi:hypothetical protein
MGKSRAAVTLGRKGGLKGGKARAASLTPAQRSESARKAIRARWARVGKAVAPPDLKQESRLGAALPADPTPDTSDRALAALLKRLRATTDIAEVRLLSAQIERVVFHKQFSNA